MLREVFVDPGEETVDDRFGLFLPAHMLCLSCEPIATTRLLDVVQGRDRIQSLMGMRGFDIPRVVDLSRVPSTVRR
ncbi:MAG: hypothetical protein NVSMB6_30000 [Burkholderiaceae bacterium]